MKDAGMSVRIDAFGNLIGRLEGTNPELPVLMMGSHLDSQPYGGRFDGVARVLCAIEVVKSMSENGIKPERPIEVFLLPMRKDGVLIKDSSVPAAFWGNWKRGIRPNR